MESGEDDDVVSDEGVGIWMFTGYEGSIQKNSEARCLLRSIQAGKYVPTPH